MELTKLIADVFGVGLVNALGLLVFWFVGKSLFTKVLDTAASNALENKKNEFATELEAIRQRFARDLEYERREAARSLEEFKADLTLGAEVRRQVAQKKVPALLEIVAKGEPLIRLAINGPASEEGPAMAEFLQFMSLVRQHQHLFTKKMAEALYLYNANMSKHMNRWNTKHDYDTIEAAGRDSSDFLDLIRSELGVQ